MNAQRPFLKPSLVVCGVLSLGAAWVPSALASFAGPPSFIHETMAMGSRGTGPSVSFGDQVTSQLISGALFQIPSGMVGEVTAIGGHMSGGNQSIDIPYAAIVKIGGGGEFPSTGGDANPLGDSTIVAANALGGVPQGSTSREFVQAMPVTLSPGSYALVFGAGGFVDELLFGPGGFVQPSADDVSDGTLVNGFFLQFPTNGTVTDTVIRWNSFGNTWMRDTSNNNIRMFVEGSLIVPEPSSLALVGAGILSIAFYRRRYVACC